MRELFTVMIVFATAITLSMIIIGVFDRPKMASVCNSKLRRIEYIFPGYRIGCWLGNVVE